MLHSVEFFYVNNNISISTVDKIMSQIYQMRLNTSECFVFACVVLHAERRPTGQ